MASGALLRCIRRIYFQHHYPAQSGFVENELKQLIERPLRRLAITANLPLPDVLQFLYVNAPTMFRGVVHNLLGHDMIFVLRASLLLITNLVKKTLLPKTLQICFPPPPDFFCLCWVETKMQNFPALWVCQRCDSTNRVTVNAHCSRAHELLIRFCVVANCCVPPAFAHKKFCTTDESYRQSQPYNGQNFFFE